LWAVSASTISSVKVQQAHHRNYLAVAILRKILEDLEVVCGKRGYVIGVRFRLRFIHE